MKDWVYGALLPSLAAVGLVLAFIGIIGIVVPQLKSQMLTQDHKCVKVETSQDEPRK